MTILCVNTNAAIDKTLIVENFQLSTIHRPNECLVLPGGKGINVARALKEMGESSEVIGWVGGFTGNLIEEKLNDEGINFQFIHTSSETRECISILDPVHNTMTEIYERGSSVPLMFVNDFITLYSEKLPFVDLVTISGSIPPGVTDNLYSKLICLAKEYNIPVLVDTSGKSLEDSLYNETPTLIKPNRQELSQLISRDLLTLYDIENSVELLSCEFSTIFAVSLGSQGLMYVDQGNILYAQPPKVNSVSAVGSGDCLLAGLAIGIKNNFEIKDMLQLAVSMGTANTLSIGAGIFQYENVEKLRPQVLVHQSSRRT